MELWEDYSTKNYYKIDQNNGSQSECNRYGEEPVKFKPYSTGFSSIPTHFTELNADSNYRVQPKKFDGYFQCPRPSSHITRLSTPYAADRRKYTPTRLPDDISKIPKPVTSLGFSRLYSPTKTPLRKSSTPHSHPATHQTTLSDFKSPQVKELPKEIKTASEILQKFIIEKNQSAGYQQPMPKPSRRQIRGIFMAEYRTSNELFMKERRMLSLTNPVAIAKEKKKEMQDIKNFEKKRAQMVLKNKLIQS